MATKEDASCKGCGICCVKGGPALHAKDAFLFEENILQVQDVLTIRAGELVRDDVENKLKSLPAELIKIAPIANARPDDWTCRFYTSKKRCFIHGKHPAECRAFYCKAPEDLMQLMHEEGLDREKICKLVNAPAWWVELIQNHEDRVNYALLAECIIKMDTEEDAKEKFLEAIEYDRSLRELVVEKAAVPEEALNFLFGRPLLQTMVMFGFDARKSADGIRLVKMADK